MAIDLLIIGQGISGTFLALEAQRLGLTFTVIDDARPFTASRVASGLINPVTGKRAVTTWLASELLPFAAAAYGDYARETSLVSFFPSPSDRLTFLQRLEQDPTYLSLPPDQAAYRTYVNDAFGYGLIHHCLLVDLARFLSDVRADLRARGLLLEQVYMPPGDIATARATISDIAARHTIFCDGMTGTSQYWFGMLPFSPSKGEALILEIPELPSDVVYKHGLNLVPLGDCLFWAGSSYEWDYADAHPTAAFRARTERALADWLRVPFRTIDHVAAIRPTTVEQKPFVGLHPTQPHIGILGGMGTKGCSLTPYFARQLAEHIAHGTPILGAADVRRFTRLLSA